MPPSPPIYFFIYLFNEGVAGTDRLLVAPADRIDAAYVAPVAISPTPIGWHEPTPRPRPPLQKKQKKKEKNRQNPPEFSAETSIGNEQRSKPVDDAVQKKYKESTLFGLVLSIFLGVMLGLNWVILVDIGLYWVILGYTG